MGVLAHIYIRISDGKRESKEFYARIDTGADLTIIPASYVKKLHFTLYNSPVTLRWGNGDTFDVIPWTGFVKFSNDILLKMSLVISEKSKEAYLGMDVLSQGSLFLTSVGGYFLINE